MRAAIRITRVGVRVTEPGLQPGCDIDQRIQLEAVDLSLVGAVGGCTIDATGLNTVHTPSFSMNLSADYAIPTQIGRFDIATIFYHNDGFYWDPANQLRQPTYSLYNASIGWMNPQERLEYVCGGRTSVALNTIAMR